MELFEKIKQFEDKIRVNKYNGELKNGLPYEYRLGGVYVDGHIKLKKINMVTDTIEF